MIDMHIHAVPPGLPGVGRLDAIEDRPPEAVAALLRAEMQAAGVTHALGMGRWDAGPDDPLGIAGTLAVAASAPGLHAIGIADPTRADRQHLRRVEAVLATGRVRALKAYLGYLHHAPADAGYRPYYELAARFGLPFIFHTGDTYSPRAKLKYAQPLLVDEVAVDHPDVSFVLAHLGNPWLLDGAEVVYKNANVWADLSGLVVGPAETFTDAANRDVLADLAAAVQRAFRYAERPDRFLYGSDWPLAPMVAYRDFIRSLLPAAHHAAVFEENARQLFRLA
jgi:predicted TIM-barrel fold metal-dependent hydrolase